MIRENCRRNKSVLLSCTAGVAGLLLAGTHAFGQTNLLLNPGFEGGVDGTPTASQNNDVPMANGGPWLSWNNWVAPYSGYYTTTGVTPHGGSQIGKTFSGPNAGIYQFVSVNAGDSYTASAWFINSSTDALNGPETDDVRMIFFGGTNGTGANLGTFVTPVPVSDLTTPDVWTQLSITANAPAGAESVQWMAFFNNPNNSGGSMFVDDAALYDNTPAGPPTLTWNNTGGTGDGATWDISTNQNWNNGTGPAVYVDGATVTFNDTNNSHYNVTLNSTVKPGSLTINSTGNYTISGTGTIGGTTSLVKMGTGTAVLSTANTYTGGTSVSNGVLQINRTSATTSALPTGPLTISGGKVVLSSGVTAGSQPTSTPASNVNLTALNISGNGTLDLGNNHIILTYLPSLGIDPISSVASWIKSGYNGGAWNGTGIMSTLAQSNAGSYGIGYADAADSGNPAGLASGQIEIMYTLLGDANLDGKVNGTDFTDMATNFNQAVTNGWDKGDFDYSGTVNGSDFLLLANNFNQFASESAVSADDAAALNSFASSNGISLTSVPEPASVGLLTMGLITGLAHRRRRKA